MAKFSLHIETEELTELHTLVARMAGSFNVTAAIDETPSIVSKEPLAYAPAGATAPKPRAKKEEAKASTPEPTLSAPQATEAVSAPAGTLATSTPTSEPGQTATTAASPSEANIPPSSQPSSSPAGAVSYEDVKAALAKLMETKSAKAAQDVLKQATGFGSLSATPVERYADALAAINAAMGS